MPGVAKTASFIIKLFGLLRVQWFVKFGVNLTAQILLPDDRVIIGWYYITLPLLKWHLLLLPGLAIAPVLLEKPSRHKTFKKCCSTFFCGYVFAGKSQSRLQQTT